MALQFPGPGPGDHEPSSRLMPAGRPGKPDYVLKVGGISFLGSARPPHLRPRAGYESEILLVPELKRSPQCLIRKQFLYRPAGQYPARATIDPRSEEHTSELQ